MASQIERLALLITANADGAISVLRGLPAEVSGSFAKVEGDASESGGRAGSAFANTAVAGLATLAATAAAFKGFSFAKDSIETAVDFQRATESINATLEATGNISGVTASGIDRISQSVENTDVVFSGAVKNAAQLLLTFDQVKNLPGEGNDIFNRTLTITPAIANVRHQDVDNLIKQVGLALENPSAGLLALKRSGVGLDDDTRNQIIQLQRRGDLLKAQKVLLDDLDRRFTAPGAAIGQSDPLQQFSVAKSELQKTVGQDLLPAATGFLHVISDAFGVLEHFPQPVRQVVELLTAASLAILPLAGILKTGGAINQIAKNTAPVAAQAIDNSAPIASEVALTEAVTAEAEAATAAVAPNAALAEQLGLFGEQAATGATGLATFTVATNGVVATTAAFDEALIGGSVGLETFEGAAAGLAPTLEATQQGFFAASEGSRLFAVDAAGIAEVIGTLDGELAFFSGELAAVGPSVLAAGTDLAVFDASVLQLDGSLPPVTEQLALFDEEVGTLAVELGPATAQLEALGLAGTTTAAELEVLDEALVTTTEEAAFLTLSFGGVFAILGAGVATLAGSSILFDKLLGGKHSSFEDLHGDVARFADDVNRINHTSFTDKVLRNPKETHQAQLDIADTNAGFTKILDDKGPKAASLALGEFIGRLIDAGYSESEAAEKLHPFIALLTAAQAAEAAASGATGDLSDKFKILDQSLSGAAANLKIGDAFDALTDAQKQLTNDKANVAGTGPEAVAGTKAVRDAFLALEDANQNVLDSHVRLDDSYTRLGDAQDRVRDSTYSLQRAQEALDDYNSPRGAEERRLQLDIIQRRVVTTPGESDQKQLDLLKFQDDNEHKQEDLSRGVTQAQKSHADALRGVTAAYREIDSAETQVERSAFKVKDAQDNIKSAIEKRQQLSKDAAESAVRDEHKVKEAAITVADTINAAAQSYGDLLDPELKKWNDRLVPILENLGLITAEVEKQNLLGGGGGGNSFGITGEKFVYPPGTVAPPPLPAPDTYTGPSVSPSQVTPHFADGDFIKRFAGGGTTEQHIAQIASAGPVRMWAEPETGGEAYIPLAESKRSRSEQILKTVAEHFGMSVVEKTNDSKTNATEKKVETRFADGGMTRNHQQQSWSSVVNDARSNSSAAAEYLARTEGGVSTTTNVDNRSSSHESSHWAYGGVEALSHFADGDVLSSVDSRSYADGGTSKHHTLAMTNVDGRAYADGGVQHFASGGVARPQLPHLPTPRESAQVSAPQSFVQNVTQENHFDASAPAKTDLDVANRELGWRLSRGGRR